jgi:hypothetical protein
MGKRALSETVLSFHETPDVRECVTAYFAENITPHLPVERRHDLSAELMSLVEADPGMAEAKKADFKAKAAAEDLNCFLAEAFIYAVKANGTNRGGGHRRKKPIPVQQFALHAK